MEKETREKERKDKFNHLLNFLRCYDKIVIHQFGFTIIYLPFYLLLSDFQLKLKEKTVEYRVNKRSDDETVRSLYENSKKDILKTELHIGLSQFWETDNEDIIHEMYSKSFIERVPLWGLSLVNNPEIMKKRKELETQEMIDYWEVFGGKFSLLNIEKFRGLKISLYPEGSTVYKTFVRLLSEKGVSLGECILFPLFSGINEFDDLFHGSADVSLTLQPTYAICRAQNEHRKLEVVYNDLTPPQPFTSIYSRCFNDKNKNKVLCKVIDDLQWLLQDKINKIYRAEQAKDEDEAYRIFHKIYCDLVASNSQKEDLDSCCTVSKLLGDPKPKEKCNMERCFTPTKTAIQILNDSRIYDHRPLEGLGLTAGPGEKSLETYICEFQIDNVLSNHIDELLSVTDLDEINPDSASKIDGFIKEYFRYDWINNINNVREDPSKAMELVMLDPIYLASKMWLQQEYLISKDHHSSLNLLLDANAETWVDAIKLSRIIKLSGIEDDNIREIIHGKHYDDIDREWSIFDEKKKYFEILPVLKEIKPEMNLENVVKFYFLPRQLANAFTHLQSNFTNKHPALYEIKDLSCVLGHIKDQERSKKKNHKDAWAWWLFQYKFFSNTINTGNTPKFMRKEDNPIGHRILNGHWIKNHSCEHVFKRPGHPKVKYNNGNILFFWDNKQIGQITLSMEADNEAWLFTFHTVL